MPAKIYVNAIKFLCIILLAIVNAFLAVHILSVNNDADLAKYILGGREFGLSYYEPISLIYLEQARFISKILNFDGYLSFQSSFLLSYFIMFRTRNIGLSLKIFWMFTLGFVIPLINVRYVPIVIFLLFSPCSIFRYIAPLCHWNLIVLLLPVKFGKYISFFLISLPILFLLNYFSLLDFAILKIKYYIEYGEKDYGTGLFVEIFLLVFLYRYLYKKAKVSSLLIFLLILCAFISAIFGFPVIASRIVVLTFLVSLLDLYNSKLNNLRLDVNITVLIIVIYETYRIFKMIGY